MHVDHVVIGAGPSGLACALRLALSGSKVILLEKHTKVGGLNSYYARPMEKNGEKIRLELDSGLHAITNFSTPDKKNSRLSKLFRSLRMNREELELYEQNFSWIKMGDKKLIFTNKIEDLTQSIKEQYPSECIGWDNFLNFLSTYDEFVANQPSYISAKIELQKFFKNEEFINHLLFPVLAYGSPWEEDMDFNLFVCIFRSMFLEGLCRPKGGIRVWWNAVLKNCEEYGVQILMGESVQKILPMENGLVHIKTSKQEIVCQNVFSSMGMIETQKMLEEPNGFEEQTSKIGFIELIVVFDTDLSQCQDLPTLNFCALNPSKYYHAANEDINTQMSIYCIPSRYQGIQNNCEGMVRMTCLTNPVNWFEYSPEEYKTRKQLVMEKMLKQMYEEFPILKNKKILLTDIFTPKTIHKYTWHHQGSLYGAKIKVKDGQSTCKQVYYIGTDQGFPGLTGSMLSGIIMANIYGIMQKNKNTV
jgi:phytoene dehydrogenase-like protein